MPKKLKKSKLQKKKDNPNSTFWKKKCDQLIKELCFKRDQHRCCYCGSEKYINAHHLITRNQLSTRWILLNLITLCAKCHKFSNTFSAHGTPVNFSHWLQINKPDQYEFCIGQKFEPLSSDFRTIYIDCNPLTT